MLEWEKIEGDELDDAFDQHDDNGRLGVLVKRARRPQSQVAGAGSGRDGVGADFGVESVVSTVGSAGAGALSGANAIARERGISGTNWSSGSGVAGSTDAAVANAAAAASGSGGTSTGRGTNGWTKLKSRER